MRNEHLKPKTKGRRPDITRDTVAYLKALAEGIPAVAAAERYLGVEHGHETVTAHRVAVGIARSLCRRMGERNSRLLGIVIKEKQARFGPTLQEYQAFAGLEDFSEEEVLLAYAEAYPVDPRAEQRTQRRRRLRERQIELLAKLEEASHVKASPTDPLDTWFADAIADKLKTAGLLLIQDLMERIASREKWWTGIPAIGPGKARQIEDLLVQEFQLLKPSMPRALEVRRVQVAKSEPQASFLNRGVVGGDANPALIDAQDIDRIRGKDDYELASNWLKGKGVRSDHTLRAYERELARYLHFLASKGLNLATAGETDLRYYIHEILPHPPNALVREGRSRIGEAGYRPFRTRAPAAATVRLAYAVLKGFYGWLAVCGFHVRDRSAGITLPVAGTRSAAQEKASFRGKAFSPAAWAQVMASIGGYEAGPRKERLLFVFGFGEATGLRACELLDARVGHVEWAAGVLCLRVTGKGSKMRNVVLAPQAVACLQRYLSFRGIPFDLDQVVPVPPAYRDQPLVGRLVVGKDANQPPEIGYGSLYKAMRRAVELAMAQAKGIPPDERERTLKASPHWLRHTFGTRATERDVPLLVVQAQMGHSDPKVTARYSMAQEHQIRDEMARAFGSSGALEQGAPPGGS